MIVEYLLDYLGFAKSNSIGIKESCSKEIFKTIKQGAKPIILLNLSLAKERVWDEMKLLEKYNLFESKMDEK